MGHFTNFSLFVILKPTIIKFLFQLLSLLCYATCSVHITFTDTLRDWACFIYSEVLRNKLITISVCVRWATGWTVGVLGFDSRRVLGIFLFTTASRTALGPTQPPIQWVSGALSLGVKRPGLESDHSLPSIVEVKDSLSTPSWCGDQLKHRDNFNFTFICLSLNLI
jgi:hypothetical protein